MPCTTIRNDQDTQELSTFSLIPYNVHHKFQKSICKIHENSLLKYYGLCVSEIEGLKDTLMSCQAFCVVLLAWSVALQRYFLGSTFWLNSIAVYKVKTLSPAHVLIFGNFHRNAHFRRAVSMSDSPSHLVATCYV